MEWKECADRDGGRWGEARGVNAHLRSRSRPLRRVLPPYPILPFLLMIDLSLDFRLVQAVDYGVFAFGDVDCLHAGHA